MNAKPSFDFNRPVDRRDTCSLKWNKYADRDVLPLWVADTDFQAPPEVAEAIVRSVDHGIFGYGKTPSGLVDVLLETLQREFAWTVDPAWLVWLPSLVTGLSVMCRSVGEEGGQVAVMTPVYPPFLSVPQAMDRRLVTLPLQGDNERGWTFDKEQLQRSLTDETDLLLFCHPHNPVGRVWREQELVDLAEVCLSRNIVVCSDEIHNQLVLSQDQKHRPLATLGPEIASRTVTLLAPSKTFNVAGLGCAVAVIPDARLRANYQRAMMGIVPYPNVLGLVAAEAAWRYGSPWLTAQIEHLRRNRDQLARCVAQLPATTMAEVQATYLAWLDLREWNQRDLAAHLEAHGLGLSDGKAFGAPGYMRLNFGCTELTLTEACERLVKACQAAQ